MRIILLLSTVDASHFRHVLWLRISWSLVNSHVAFKLFESILLIIYSLLVFVYHLNFQFARLLAWWLICRWICRRLLVLWWKITVLRKLHTFFTSGSKIWSWELTSVVLTFSGIYSTRFLNFVFANNVILFAPSFWSAIVHIWIWCKSLLI